jgi:hypothetical protein
MEPPMKPTKTALMLMLLLGVLAVAADEKPAAEDKPPAKETPAAPGAVAPRFDGITINLQERFIDVEAEVCLEEGILENIATVPSAKEHESIIVVKARPRNIHFALLMMGLKNGTPGRFIYKPDKVVPVDPTGDKVRVSLVVDRDGKKVEEPITNFIHERKSGKHLESDVFVFAGSRLLDQPDQKEPLYAADATGDVVSLVSFDDEMLSPMHAASNSNETLLWEIDKKVTPKLGTKVVMRLRPVVEKAEKKDEKK